MSAPFESRFTAVKAAARGRWPEILAALGIPAESLTNKHMACPGCAGRDRYRFDDKDGDGSWICGGGGELRSGDGFALLGHVLGMTPGQALAAVSAYLGMDRVPSHAERRGATTRRTEASRAVLDEALLLELTVLSSIVSARVSDRNLAKDLKYRVLHPEFRPMPPGAWERETQAAARIRTALETIYG